MGSSASRTRRALVRLKRAFTENVPLKLLSVILTVILYFLVRQDAIDEFTIQVSVTLNNTPVNKVFVGDVPPKLDVHISGRWSRILDVVEANKRQQPFSIDLNGYQDGEVLRFDPREMERYLKQPGIQVVSIDPPQLTVSLDRFLSKLVTVVPSLVGDTADGYEVDRTLIQIKPQSVWIEGPYDRVAELREVHTLAIEVSGLEKDFRTDIPLEPPRQRFVKLQTERVTVEIPVRERMHDRTFRDFPLRVDPCPPGYDCRVDPPTIEVHVIGRYFAVSKLTEDDLQAKVSVPREGAEGIEGTFDDQRVRTQPGKDLVLQVRPDTVRVEITRLRDWQVDERLRQPMAQE